jgi:hypothetical protein
MRSTGLFAALATIAAWGCGDSGHASAGHPATDGGEGGVAAMADGGDAQGDGGDDSSGNPAQDGGGADGASGDGGDGASGVNPHPTVSAWMGTNVAADLSRVDITYQLKPFDTAAAQRDANGYPVAGASGTSATDIGFVLPSGTYKISFKGTGSLAVSGIGTLGGAWQTLGGENRSTVQITGTPGSFGHFLNLAITNGTGQTVTDVHIYSPGFDYDTSTVFLPQFIALLGPFRAMRFMDWEATNGNTIVAWADRPAAAHYGQSSYGEPYEHIVELVNETGKDAWITVPEHASDDFITQLSSFWAQNLDFSRIQPARDKAGFTTPFQLIVEDSNETWNQAFTAYATFLAAANANASRYPGTYGGTYGPSWMTSNSDLMKVGQYHADRLVKIGNAFRSAFNGIGRSGAIAPVLSGWALGPGYTDDGLAFISANYGDPKNYVTYVAQAPYFDTADDTTTGALSTLFPALQTNISGMHSTFTDFAKLASQYGVKMSAYEGGQSITGTTNQTIKHLAQHDERMYETYKTYLSQWKADFGSTLFMHFSLAGQPGLPENIYQYGYWGSIIGVLENTTTCEQNLPTLAGTEAIASVVHHCPKYRALAEQVP